MSNIRTSKPSLRASEVGMISIMTTMVLMIIISLIALGFAQISRRNQRESLDRQLSTQAFYAAESGVNDARDLIANAVNAGTTVPDKDACDDNGAGAFYATLNPVIDAAKNVEYSCLLVDTAPTELRYSDVGRQSLVRHRSQVVPPRLLMPSEPVQRGPAATACSGSTLSRRLAAAYQSMACATVR